MRELALAEIESVSGGGITVMAAKTDRRSICHRMPGLGAANWQYASGAQAPHMDGGGGYAGAEEGEVWQIAVFDDDLPVVTDEIVVIATHNGPGSTGMNPFRDVVSATMDFIGMDGSLGFGGWWTQDEGFLIGVGNETTTAPPPSDVVIFSIDGQIGSGFGLAGAAGIYYDSSNGDFGIFGGLGAAAGGGAAISGNVGSVTSIAVLEGNTGTYNLTVGPADGSLIISPGSGTGSTIGFALGGFSGGTSTYGDYYSLRDALNRWAGFDQNHSDSGEGDFSNGRTPPP